MVVVQYMNVSIQFYKFVVYDISTPYYLKRYFGLFFNTAKYLLENAYIYKILMKLLMNMTMSKYFLIDLSNT